MFSHSYAAWYHAGAPASVPRHAISKTAMDHGYTMGEVGMPLGEKGENFTAVFFWYNRLYTYQGIQTINIYKIYTKKLLMSLWQSFFVTDHLVYHDFIPVVVFIANVLVISPIFGRTHLLGTCHTYHAEFQPPRPHVFSNIFYVFLRMGLHLRMVVVYGNGVYPTSNWGFACVCSALAWSPVFYGRAEVLESRVSKTRDMLRCFPKFVVENSQAAKESYTFLLQRTYI